MEKGIGKTASRQMLIETPQLIIKGNIMSWYDTMIQLSNVSCITAKPLPDTTFPFFSVVLLLLGIISLFLQYNITVSTVLLGSGFVWICIWCYVNEQRSHNTILNIIMNSGIGFKIVFKDKVFLVKVLTVLEQIIINGGVGQQDVFININGCSISGNANVLSDLKLS